MGAGASLRPEFAMSLRNTTDWTNPETYLSGVAPPSTLRRLLVALDRWLAAGDRAARARRNAVLWHQLRTAPTDVPSGLRRDLGLPPIEQYQDVSQYR